MKQNENIRFTVKQAKQRDKADKKQKKEDEARFKRKLHGLD
jgi:hypothetical protein